MKKLFVLLLVFITVLGVVTAGGSAESANGVKMLKLGSTTPAATYSHEALQYFQSRVRELSGGKLDMTIHMGGTLGTTAQEYAQLREGSLDMFQTAFDTASVLRGGQDFTVTCVPYVFDDMEHYHKFAESDLGLGMIAEVEKQNGIHFLGILAPMLPRALSTTNRPVTSVADVANLKIRVSEAQSIYEMWKAWGANPVIISGGELYSSLESGLADGQDNDVVSTHSSGMGEIQDYYTELDYIQQCIVLWFSQSNWDKLSDEEKGWIETALNDTYTHFEEVLGQQYEEAKQALIDEGVTFIEPDIESFKEATEASIGVMDGVLFREGLYDEIRALNN